MPLIHEFRRSGQTTRTIDGSGSKLADFQNESSLDGGTSGMSGTISTAEYAPRTALYQDGSTWLVKDTVTNEYFMGGLLRDPEEPGGGEVKLAADGWGKLGDNDAGHFLVSSYDLSQWSVGDEDPFTQGGWEKIQCRIGASRIRWRIRAHTAFRRNQAGNPTKWHSGVYRWTPGVFIKRIAFTIDKPRTSPNYFFEVVGITSPTGTPVILGTYGVGAGDPTSVDLTIAGNYEVIGVRLMRTDQTKHAPRRRFSIKNLRIGSLTTTDTYTLNQAFTELANRLGATPSISASSVNIAPFDAHGTIGQIADELALFDNWFWRLEPNPSTGAMVLNAGPMGKKTWSLTRDNSPVNLIPEQRYNQVRVPYRKGGLILHKTVLASPNPFPGGVFRTFDMQWDEPPHEDVATLFAQKAANLLAPKHSSGTAAFTYVTSGGEKHGTAVMPGDQLTLTDQGSKTVTVESVSTDSDGSVTVAEFMTGDPILYKLLAKRQRLLNKGLSPDAATMGILDPDEPAAPTNVVIAFTSETVHKRDGRKDFDMIITWDHSGEDVNGDGTYVNRAVVKFRPTDAAGTPIPHNEGGGWREKKIRNTKDTEDDGVEAPTRCHVEKVPHPWKWKWEAKVAVIDLLGQRSEYTASATKEKPGAFGPPVPTGLTMDVDQHYVHIAWDEQAEASDANLTDQGISYAQVEFDDANTFTSLLRQDKKVKSQSKTWRFKKPLGGTTYWGRVRLVDFWGNVSAWVTVSGTTKAPPTPGIDTTGTPSKTHFDTKGTRKGRWRAVIVPTVVGAYGEDDIDVYEVRIVHHATAGATPPAGARRYQRQIEGDATGDELVATLKGIPRNHTVWARVASKDRQGRRSPFSSWLRMGTPRNPIAPVDSVKDSAPSPPTNVVVDKTHPRKLRATWDDVMETNEEIDHYLVRVYQGVTLKQERRMRKNHHEYDIPRADRNLGHRMRVYSVDDVEQISSTYNDQGADTVGNEVFSSEDLGLMITQSSAQLGTTWLVEGTMELAAASGQFITGPSPANRVALSKLEGSDRATFYPTTGSKTVLEAGTDGIRWGGAGSTILSRLRQDSTLQLGRAAAGVVPNSALQLYLRDQGGQDQFVAKFGKTGNVRVIATQ